MKVGIDVLEINRIDVSENFIDKICTENEKGYISNFSDKSERLAGLFCAKEAVFKSLDIDFLNHKEIEILHKENGRPYVILHGKTAKKINPKLIDVSISHTKTIATAVCICKTNE